MFISLSLASKAEFMIGFLLISLGPCIPILSIVFDVGIPTNKRFSAIDSNDSDDFSPLIDDIAFFVSFDDVRLNLIKIIDSILHIHVIIEIEILRT